MRHQKFTASSLIYWTDVNRRVKQKLWLNFNLFLSYNLGIGLDLLCPMISWQSPSDHASIAAPTIELISKGTHHQHNNSLEIGRPWERSEKRISPGHKPSPIAATFWYGCLQHENIVETTFNEITVDYIRVSKPKIVIKEFNFICLNTFERLGYILQHCSFIYSTSCWL